MTDGELCWTKQWPHERLKHRLNQHGFTERDIEQALSGKARLWEVLA
ncbi:MAG: hypothetical protein HC853_08025 [Anaerolineae bacterium]|nr:hypothetical protein [Anaerolineae bacterium]